MTDETKTKLIEEVRKIGMGMMALLIIALLAWYNHEDRRQLNLLINTHLSREVEILDLMGKSHAKQVEILDAMRVNQKKYFEEAGD